ncbi:MAG TPA: asparagine synthase (glutamine-hydrolyzing) [Candidatus Eisenbacteria bacterium]|nr:asparagine synthase (glutamine-hydrolyzing) [Candidatus Eisenbacteria bacterium]
MCGIAGAVETADPPRLTESVLHRMASLIAHRGPDNQGAWLAPPAGLCHRRLSIIDLSAAGNQPMSLEGTGLTMVFNGEIYNFPELRSELEGKGVVFRSRSDTEVLLRAYEAWDVGCLDHINGMFAFAIWDAPRRRLFAARDRLGKKPFFYHARPGRFVFGSEMKAILGYGGIDRDIDPHALDEFLSTGCIGAPRTILRTIRKLPPAHYLLLEEDRITIRPYWDVTFQVTEKERTEEERLERLEHLFREAVRRRMISDVPLGAFLSGGIDSSAVVGMMAQLSDRPVKTYTIGFEEEGYSEIEDARMIARHFGTDHHEFQVRPEAIGILPDLVWHFDEPFGDSSAIPTYYVSKMAVEHVKVALAGDGGDELFAGYTRYQDSLRVPPYHLIPASVRRRVLAPLADRMPLAAPGRNRLYAAAHHAPLTPGYGLGLYPYIKEQLLSPEWRTQTALREPNGHTAVSEPRLRSMDLLSRLQYLDTKVYLPEDILTKVDRMSMAHSLEVRAPLLDYTLIEYVASIPPALKLRDSVSKYLFRKMASRYLPASVFEKPKQGFGVPTGAWFQQELRASARERLLDRRTLDRGYFRRRTVERVLDLHEAGQRDYGTWIWCLLVLEEWHRTFLDADTRRV